MKTIEEVLNTNGFNLFQDFTPLVTYPVTTEFKTKWFFMKFVSMQFVLASSKEPLFLNKPLKKCTFSLDELAETSKVIMDMQSGKSIDSKSNVHFVLNKVDYTDVTKFFKKKRYTMKITDTLEYRPNVFFY